jgi:2-polyprenyl-3-methyl-5-hydroxy-6-metoxy-1,4-benzoquinol methylase
MSPDPSAAAYTHGHHESVLRSHQWRTAANSAAYLLPYLDPGAALLDVGAGPGTITADLAERVAHVTATEIGERELDLTRRTASRRGASNMSFATEDVGALSFRDATFDVVHTHQVLQHVADPVLALGEMARVTRPGGIVAARDADYGGFLWYPDVPEIGEWIRLYYIAARANGGEPDAGRRLLAWAREAGLAEVTATASAWCFASVEDRAWWAGTWADRMVESAVARQLVDGDVVTAAHLRRLSHGWRRWADIADGWFMVPHGEIIYRKPAAL